MQNPRNLLLEKDFRGHKVSEVRRGPFCFYADCRIVDRERSCPCEFARCFASVAPNLHL